MKSAIAAITILTIMIISACQTSEPKAPNQDNVIIEKALYNKYDDGGFTVVNPITEVTCLPGAPEVKTIVKEGPKLEGYDLEPLLVKLLEKNRVSKRLSIESHPERGYLVDYAGQYKKDFENNGGGWDAWYRHHPKAHGFTSVSLPVYDEKHGVVLIYMDTQMDGLAAAGSLVVYRYEKGNLKELARILLWFH